MSDYQPISCFKAYDIRGKVPDELNEDLAYRIGRAYVQFLGAKKVIIGRDIRPSGPALGEALAKGLTQGGADVVDIGLCGTEMIYFATPYLRADGGIMITASHNPPEYNGMKLVREGSRPISADTGLKDIERLASLNQFEPSTAKGTVKSMDIMDHYIQQILKVGELNTLPPYKLVVNAGNGCAGIVIDKLEEHLPFAFIKIQNEPDGSFPHGVPNPLLPENRFHTAEAVKAHKADAGIAWDGDFDRCFFFDEKGNFIEGYFIVGFLAQSMLEKHPGAKIVYDPRLVWNTIEIVEQNGGIPLMSKSGHSFIKEVMRKEEAVYGGEMSAHHYFKEFSYSDSGMIPWLLVLEIMSKKKKPLSQLVAERIQRYPVSGEINRRVTDQEKVIDRIKEHYASQNPQIDLTDGLSCEFDRWRFNVRESNTEPILRLNVETREDPDLLEEKTDEVLSLIEAE